MIINPMAWLEKVWPSPIKRARILRAYIELGRNPGLLADIALRGNVWSPLHVPGDAETTAYNVGRRDLALEIIKLAGTNPAALFGEIEKLTQPKQGT